MVGHVGELVHGHGVGLAWLGVVGGDLGESSEPSLVALLFVLFLLVEVAEGGK